MIYLANSTTSEQLCCVPRTGIEIVAEQTATMTLRSTVARTTVLTADVRVSGCSSLYHYIYLTLPEGVQVGEYEYTLTQDEAVVASGIIRVGHYTPAEVQGTGGITFRQGN